MRGWTGSRRWLFVGLGVMLARDLLHHFGLVELPYLWGQVVFLISGSALTLSAAFGLRDKWHYGFARGLVGVVAALMLGLPVVQIIQYLTEPTLGVSGALMIMGGIWAATWIALRHFAQPGHSG
jgi:hypothetical protein